MFTIVLRMLYICKHLVERRLKLKPPNLNAVLSVRIPLRIRTKFYKKADQHGGVPLLVRELVQAFVEDRLKITPKGPLYDTRSEN